MTVTSTAPRFGILIVAAGRGERAGMADGPKQYRKVGEAPVLLHTVRGFARWPHTTAIVIAIHADDGDLYQSCASAFPTGVRIEAVTGGATRQASVLKGLEALEGSGITHVMIHDAVRPFFSLELLDRIRAQHLSGERAVLPVTPVADTLKRSTADGYCDGTVPREGLQAAQTPQSFEYPLILAGHRAAAEAGRLDFTDDAAVAEWAGIPVRLVEGERGNTKITTAEDLAEAETRMTLDRFAALADVRVGWGYDVHSFEPGDHVTLCGVKIPYEARLNGHSDADVPLHALTDAILGALGDGDIGAHFPPSEAKWRGCDSAVFVRDALARLARRGGILAHVDVTIVAEAPKIGPHREAMRARVAEICGITLDRVGVKATTNEKLGFVGRREGIAAMASATVRLPLA